MTPEHKDDKNNAPADIPVPDPTLLTTRNLQREIASLKELLFVRIDCLQELANASEHQQEAVSKDIGIQVHAAKELIFQRFETSNEKFASIQLQFKERDVRVEQTARDTKVAVDAALQAAEKAVGKQNEAFGLSIAKSETATAKQIDQQGQLLNTTTAGLNDKIDDIKERLTSLEGEGRGLINARTSQHTSQMSAVSVISLIVGGLALLSSIAIALIRFQH